MFSNSSTESGLLGYAGPSPIPRDNSRCPAGCYGNSMCSGLYSLMNIWCRANASILNNDFLSNASSDTTEIPGNIAGTLSSDYPSNGTLGIGCHGNESLYEGCEPPRTVETVVVPVVWGTLILVGILGNGLVVYVMLLYGEMNTTNSYILNLAFSDLAFTGVVIPLTMVHYVSTDWIFGSFLCKFHMYLIYVTMQATCLTLTAMTIDRYYAIVHPIRSISHRTPKKVVCINCCIWIVAHVVNIPFAMYHGLVDSTYYGPRVYCREIWPSQLWARGAIIYVVIVTYIIPLGIILVCYSKMMKHLLKKDGDGSRDKARNVQGERRRRAAGTSHLASQNYYQHHHHRKRRKASKMIAVVVILFSFLWLPIHILQLWIKFDSAFPRNEGTYIFKVIAHTLSYANSCCNPFVYSFLGDGFRKAVRRAFPCLTRRIEVTSLALDVVNKPGTTRDEERCTFPTSGGNHGTKATATHAGTSTVTSQRAACTTHLASPTRVQRIRIVPRPECALVSGEAGLSVPGETTRPLPGRPADVPGDSILTLPGHPASFP